MSVLATAIREASFADHVMRVVFGCAEKQMIRPHAAPVVARMANAVAVWNRSVSQLISYTAGMSRTAFVPEFCIAVVADAGELPAFARLIDLRPEAVSDILYLGSVGAFLRAEDTDLRREVFKGRATDRTSAGFVRGVIDAFSRSGITGVAAELTNFARSVQLDLTAVFASVLNFGGVMSSHESSFRRSDTSIITYGVH